MKAIYFDAFSGASGDMIVGALIDAGADLEALRRGLESLRVPGYHIQAEKVVKHGVTATQFRVVIDESHVAPHRHLRHILEIINAGDLSPAVKEASAKTFTRIAEVEAAIHNTTVEKIHFHEVGAIDSIVDVVGAHLALELLGVERVYASKLHVGSGVVHCAHGVMPVPAPATAALLEGVPCYGGEVEGELVTPTGAALLSQLAARFGPMPTLRVQSVGYGSGTRDYAGRANVLRAIVGELEETAGATEEIVVIETNIDDMNPELYPPLIEDLLTAGARDAFLTPILGKKGRPGQLITVLCNEEKVQAIAQALFRASTTLGLRMRTERRLCLERTWKSVKTPWGVVRVKIGAWQGQTTVMAPEFEECRARAAEAEVTVREVYDAALAAARGGEFLDE